MSTVEEGAELEHLLDYLRASRAFDFTGYKRPSLLRRINKRMAEVHVESLEQYVDYLEVHPEEFMSLFNTILINVTSFFRDPPVWDFLAAEVLHGLLAATGDTGPVRVWVPGCASGQEAYTLAMLLSEAMGADAFLNRVKIFGTDVDEEALHEARRATYSAKEVESVDPVLRAKYFRKVGANFVFHPDLRRSVIFGRHDLAQHAPISKIDLLSCRNTLMYFNAEAQAGIISRFRFSLRNEGILILGRAEMLVSGGTGLDVIDIHHRLFKRLISSSGGLPEPGLTFSPGADDGDVGVNIRVRDLALDAGPVARIVVDAQGMLLFATEPVRESFGISKGDIGRPLATLELSHRPIGLPNRIREATDERRAVVANAVEYVDHDGTSHIYDVVIEPLVGGDSTNLGVSVSYVDVTLSHQLQVKLEEAQQVLETTNEELETTNEELQSTNEELETTNEELQSTNEELETTNEELQSTNAELQTIGDEIQQRNVEATQTTHFTEAILTSLKMALIAVDAVGIVTSWNDRATDTWGVRAEEAVGVALWELEIGLPADDLRALIGESIDGRSRFLEKQLVGTNRRGRTSTYLVTLTPLLGPGEGRAGVVLMMEEVAPA